MRRRSRDEVTAAREATNATTPWTIWSHATELTAIRKGADANIVRKSTRIRAILARAFRMGEPVWMAADEVALVAKAEAKPVRSPRQELRSAVAAYYTRPGRVRRSSKTRGHL